MSQQTTWRPVAAIRAVAIGLARRDRQLLVVEVLDEQGRRKGWRPPGGGMHFMETSAAALKREILEELGCGIEIAGDPAVCENLYQHAGAPGHEIVFVYAMSLLDASIYAQDRLHLREDDGTVHRLEWIEIERFRSGRETLFPDGLVARLSGDTLTSPDHQQRR
jgi:8-oxo-dGTP pyrophosphatase MutT (NUDIX family)